MFSAIFIYRYHKFSEMEQFVENLYKCNFNNMENGVADGMTDVLSGMHSAQWQILNYNTSLIAISYIRNPIGREHITYRLIIWHVTL